MLAIPHHPSHCPKGLDTKFKQGQWAGDFKDMGSCEMYDPTTCVWTTMAPMPYRCNSGRCVVVGKEVYIMGGSLDVANDPFKMGIVQVLGRSSHA